MKIKSTYVVDAAREFPSLDTWEILDIAATRQERAENRPYNSDDYNPFTFDLDVLGRTEFLRQQRAEKPARLQKLKVACDRLRAARATTK